jgi:hypothetical protein
MIISGEQVRNWKEMTADQLNVLSSHSFDETEENHKEHYAVHSIGLPSSESYTF